MGKPSAQVDEHQQPSRAHQLPHTASLSKLRGNKEEASGGFDFSSLEIEEVIYWIRKSADEFIQLLYVADYFKRNQSYPARVAIDSIGPLLSQTDSDLYGILATHHSKLKQLNDAANAYKHSFLSSAIHLIGRDDPLVFYSVPWNDLSKPAVFNSIRLADFVGHFDELYQFLRMKYAELFSSKNGSMGTVDEV